MIENLGGQIRAKGDELIVEVPHRGRSRAEGIQAARLLFAAPEIVIAALRTKLGVDAIPARELRAGGGVDGR